MRQTQLLLDFDDERDPMKARMLEWLSPVCIHSPRLWNQYRPRTCHCASNVKAALRTLDTFQQKNSDCEPSIELLATRAGCSVRTMQRWLRMSEELGYVSTIIRDRSTSCYSINWLRIWNETEEPNEDSVVRLSAKVGAI